MMTRNPPRSLLARGLFFTALWALLSENNWHDLPLIAGIIVMATASSFALWPVAAWRWHLWPLVKFAPYFLQESVAGGLDVARRAFSPTLPLDPGIEDFELRLGSEPARVFFAWTVSLLPGTASVRLEETRLRMHVLDRGQALEEKLRELERRIGAIFGDGCGFTEQQARIP
jgi:multicomponent Na+:H+ antiporter subunit E